MSPINKKIERIFKVLESRELEFNTAESFVKDKLEYPDFKLNMKAMEIKPRRKRSEIEVNNSASVAEKNGLLS